MKIRDYRDNNNHAIYIVLRRDGDIDVYSEEKKQVEFWLNFYDSNYDGSCLILDNTGKIYFEKDSFRVIVALSAAGLWPIPEERFKTVSLKNT